MLATNLSPSLGPTSGGSAVTVVGSGFTGAQTDQLDRFTCLFAGPPEVRVAASILSDSSVSCASPPARVGLQQLQLALDAETIGGLALYFLHHGAASSSTCVRSRK